MKDKIVLFGAGGAGRYALKYLRSKGIEPTGFADNDPQKWGTIIDGLLVNSPVYSDSTWIATALQGPFAREIRYQMAMMGVRSKPLWEVLPVCHGLPPAGARQALRQLTAHDNHSYRMLHDQMKFRENPDYEEQLDCDNIQNIYFPDFISHLENEHFVDCGAADGDTIEAFQSRWEQWGHITAFEPDPRNRQKLGKYGFDLTISIFSGAVSDHRGKESLTANGDESSHLGGGSMKVSCIKLDDSYFRNPPTYIKMDIEGAELEALWGARRILKEYRPVLAICAYHTSDHLWQIPLLIHAIQPDYKLFFRRYAEGAFEIVWYAVPPERVQ